MLQDYLKQIAGIAGKGDAWEESYYSALSSLLLDFAHTRKKRKIDITILPKKTLAGNPDFRVWDGRRHIIGYVEAKPPDEQNLDRIEESQQLKRYRGAFSNLILTNFFEFRLYRDGKLVDGTQIGRPFVAHQLRLVPPVEKAKPKKTKAHKKHKEPAAPPQ